MVDGTIASIGIPAEPIELQLEGGALVSASGEEGRRLLDLLTVHGPDATRVAELGIGTNEKAIASGEFRILDRENERFKPLSEVVSGVVGEPAMGVSHV